MSTGLLDCLLNTQSKTAIPAGQKMQVVMIDRGQLHRNPDNRIYIIGDVSRLKEDIRANGIRQPLEVVELPFGGYKLIGGERRLTACEELAKEGVEGFDMLPCVIRESKDADDDKIALITANATARDLTDGERLAQYEALKEVLTRKKHFGQLQGKVRDELCRILGLSTGAAARLNAIAENCGDDTKRSLRTGEITLMEAYRRAQDVIAAKNPPKEPAESPESMPGFADSSAPEQKPLETLPKAAPEYPEWVLESAKEVCSMDFVKSAPEFTGEALAKGKGDMCGRSLKKGFVDFYRDKIRFWGMGKGEYVFTWAKFVRFCIEKGIAPQKAKSEPGKNVSDVCKNSAPEPRGRATLLALAEKTLNEKGGWIFDRDLWKFKLDFYKKELPGGAYLWRLDDTQRDAVGFAPGEHVRYAIIYKSGDFFTTGWENYTDAVESLIRYLDLK
jgi:ParB-like chromosome segregation protein Spo0J|nr:MAG TPA_asm: chromosome partitioning protein [Caudoviricetes sp.]